MKRIRLLLAAFTACCAAAVAAPPAGPTMVDVEVAFEEYDLDRASSFLDKYKARRSKQRGATETDSVDAYGNRFDPVELMQERILLARNMLDRVEKVEVVDSIHVPREEFFSMMRLDPSSGRLLDESAVAAALPPSDARRALEPVYSSENGDMLLWVGYDDSDENLGDEFTLYQSDRLADGSFAAPQKLFTRSSLFPDGLKGEIFSPFLMADGMTLYFAADGPQSLGGLDIFIARRDANGGFLQPSNVGMPFNSPANDYMMAVDEVTGFGWWVTDRDAPEGMVTIYLFIPSELRVNFPPDTEGLASYALLKTRYKSDRPESDIRERMQRLTRVRRPAEGKTPKFEFALPDGRIITAIAQLHAPEARRLMASYLTKKREVESLRAELEKMRAAYAAGNRSLADTILDNEKSLEDETRLLRELANDVVRAEQ